MAQLRFLLFSVGLVIMLGASNFNTSYACAPPGHTTVYQYQPNFSPALPVDILEAPDRVSFRLEKPAEVLLAYTVDLVNLQNRQIKYIEQKRC